MHQRDVWRRAWGLSGAMAVTGLGLAAAAALFALTPAKGALEGDRVWWEMTHLASSSDIIALLSGLGAVVAALAIASAVSANADSEPGQARMLVLDDLTRLASLHTGATAAALLPSALALDRPFAPILGCAAMMIFASALGAMAAVRPHQRAIWLATAERELHALDRAIRSAVTTREQIPPSRDRNRSLWRALTLPAAGAGLLNGLGAVVSMHQTDVPIASAIAGGLWLGAVVGYLFAAGLAHTADRQLNLIMGAPVRIGRAVTWAGWMFFALVGATALAARWWALLLTLAFTAITFLLIRGKMTRIRTPFSPVLTRLCVVRRRALVRRVRSLRESEPPPV